MNSDNKNASVESVKKESSVKKFISGLTFGKILKSIATLLIILVYVLLIGRMLLARTTGIMDRYLWTENALRYYNSSPESFSVMTQQLSESINKEGYYHISNLAYVRDAGELQITVRYNNSTLKTLNTFYSDSSDAGETFVFTLTDSTGKVYDKYSYVSSSNIIYNFRRLVFEGVDFSNAGTLYLNVYYVNDLSDSAPMSISFRVFDEDNTEIESNIDIKYKNAKADKLNPSPIFAYIKD